MREHVDFHDKEHYSPECPECKRSVTVSKWSGNDEEICLRCGASRTALLEMIVQGDRDNLSIVEIITGNCPSCRVALMTSQKD